MPSKSSLKGSVLRIGLLERGCWGLSKGAFIDRNCPNKQSLQREAETKHKSRQRWVRMANANETVDDKC